jgi:hypothetical protein
MGFSWDVFIVTSTLENRMLLSLGANLLNDKVLLVVVEQGVLEILILTDLVK